MIDEDTARTMYELASLWLGGETGDWTTLSSAEQLTYFNAAEAAQTDRSPESMYAAIGSLWGQPEWADMNGAQRVSYVFLVELVPAGEVAIEP